MNVEYLANHPEFLNEIAEAVFAEWRELCDVNGVDLDRVTAVLAERAVTQGIPVAFVVRDDNEWIATGSIKAAEPATKEGVSPWLDMMYVKNHRRGSGTGGLLLRFMEQQAAAMGYTTLYLSTDEAEGFYARHGWAVIEYQTAADGKTVAFMAKDIGEGRG